jgi:small ligand-binding sensory domain FIST
VPRPKIQPEIVQATARFEHEVSKTSLPVSQRILDHPIALDPADGVLNADTNTGNQAIGDFVDVGQFTPFGFLFR